MVEIRRICGTDDFTQLRDLFAAYEADLPPDLRHGNLPDVSALSNEFSGANAAFLATSDGAGVGCVAVTTVDAETVLLRHLFVKPQSRGLGAARGLVAAVIALARERKHWRVRLDTHKERLEPAYRLYRSFGFEECGPFGAVDYDSPTFMELRLDPTMGRSSRRRSNGTHMEIASGFCQVAWVVKDIAAAEKFFLETMGIGRFMHMENLAAKDTEGTYLGKPGNWVCHLYLAYAGDTQIELIQPVSGESMFQESLDRHGDAVQHVAYFIDDSAYDDAGAHMESSGYPQIQSFRLPIARVGYFDTRPAIGVVTEIVGVQEAGHQFLRDLKSGNF